MPDLLVDRQGATAGHDDLELGHRRRGASGADQPEEVVLQPAVEVRRRDQAGDDGPQHCGAPAPGPAQAFEGGDEAERRDEAPDGRVLAPMGRKSTHGQ